MTVAPIVIRTLASEYRLHLPAAEDAERFRFMEAIPQLPGAELKVTDVVFTGDEGLYRTHLPRVGAVDGTFEHCFDQLTRLLLWDQFWSHGAYPMIHGATLRVNGKKLLLVGDKGTGKSTLVLHMLARGHDAEGDEHLTVLDGDVIARPRRLRIRPSSLELVAPLPAGIQESPRVAVDGMTLWSVDPGIFGRPWVISRGRLDAILIARPNRGGFSRLRTMGPEDAFRLLQRNSYVFPGSVGHAMARLRALATSTPTFELRLGRLDTAEMQVLRLTAA